MQTSLIFNEETSQLPSPVSKFDKETMTMMAIRNRLACQLCDVFDWIFRRPGTPYGLHFFWSNLFGFDIVKFDKLVIKSGDACLADFIESHYGKMAVNLIWLLLSKTADMENYLESPEGKLSFDDLQEYYHENKLVFIEICVASKLP